MQGATMDAMSSAGAVQSAMRGLSGSGSPDAVQLLVLRKAMEVQTLAAAQMLQALPQATPATSGNLGTRINTYA
jgi:hypothetical protein